MSISIDQIKALRDKTGVSISACKKALVEAEGDEQKAIELLRKKGQAKAAERSDRSTSEGVVAVAQAGGKVAMVELVCETDFVAKNDDFVANAKSLAEKVLAEGAEVNLESEISDLNIQMGEKVDIRERVVLEGATLGSYIHLNNKIGVVIALDGGEEATAADIAMHIAAMNPQNISPDEVDDALVAKEKEIWIDQLKEEGKPENIIENILKGKEAKFRGENALLTQPFAKNPEQKVGDLLGDVSVVDFRRFSI